MKKDYSALVDLMEKGIPFNRYLGLRIEGLRDGYARMILPFRKEFIGDKRRPALHGGVISTLIDVCGGTAAWTHFNMEDAVATIDVLVDYLRPGPDGDIVAESEVIRVGGRIVVVNTRVSPAGNREEVIATGRAAYNVRRKSAS